MPRRTKIVATIGPASDDPKVLRRMAEAGVDMARVSFAHGPMEANLERIARVREAMRTPEREVGILADLPGPKIRAAAFPDEGIVLDVGSRVTLAPA